MIIVFNKTNEYELHKIKKKNESFTDFFDFEGIFVYVYIIYVYIVMSKL